MSSAEHPLRGVTIVYIIVAHKNPDQVVRLIRRLATDAAMFVVHVDRKSPAEVGEVIRRGVDGLADVRFITPHRCFWGGFGMVRATLAAIRKIVELGIPFEYIVLLSGQDYPLRPPREIERFLCTSGGRSFMSTSPLPVAFWLEGGLPRIEKVHLLSYGRLRYHLRVPWHRRIPGDLAPFGGEAWWCLPRPVVSYIHDFATQRRRFVRFFRHVLHPDEIFFQTIVMNSPFAETVCNDDLRFVDWSPYPGPAILRADDFDRLTQTGKLFARKFDQTVDTRILDLLDAHIEGRLLTSARSNDA